MTSDFEVDFNVENAHNQTPLHFASYFGQYEVVKFLFKNHEAKGIDVSRKSNNGSTAEDFARGKGHQNILEVLEMWTREIEIDELTKKAE